MGVEEKCAFFKRETDPRDSRLELQYCGVLGSDRRCGGIRMYCGSPEDFVAENGQTPEEILRLLLQTPTIRRKLKAPRIRTVRQTY